MEEETATKKRGIGFIAGLCVVIVTAIIVIIAVITVMLNNENAVIGKYSAYSYINIDGEESTKEVSLLKAFGADIIIEFQEDHKGKITTDYSSSTLFNSEENADAVIDTKQSQSFEWKDGKITNLEQTNDEKTRKSGTYKLSDDKKYVIVTIEGEEKSVKFERAE